MTRQFIQRFAVVSGLLSALSCSSTLPNILVKPVPDTEWQYELSSEKDSPPNHVREAFEAKATEICGAANPRRVFRFVEIRREPRANEPQSVRDAGMDGVIECVEP